MQKIEGAEPRKACDRTCIKCTISVYLTFRLDPLFTLVFGYTMPAVWSCVAWATEVPSARRQDEEDGWLRRCSGARTSPLLSKLSLACFSLLVFLCTLLPSSSCRPYPFPPRRIVLGQCAIPICCCSPKPTRDLIFSEKHAKQEEQ